MKRLCAGLSMFGLLALIACGGRAIDDSGSGGADPESPATTDTAGKGGKPSVVNPGKGSEFPGKALGACEPGFLRTDDPTRPCRWLTESGMCFDKSEAACNCICPRDRDSLCVHGFGSGPNGATLIECD